MKSVGMRTIKTGISVFLCVLVAHVIKLEYPFYASIAAVITLQSSVTASFHAGKNRMLGTLLGAAIGFIFALLLPGNSILCGLGVIIVIYMLNILNWKNSVSIGCIVFLVIMTNLNGRSPFIYSINRILDTFIGIIIALFVNYIIYPPKYLERIILLSNKLVDTTLILSENKLCHNEDINLENIKKQISELDACITAYKKDVLIKKKEVLEIDKIEDIIQACNSVLMHHSILESFDKSAYINEENVLSLKTMFNSEIEEKSTSSTNKEIEAIYNYHLKNIINNLHFLLSVTLNRDELRKI
jgi:uncharacterized membrane protein YgaE (UPF0421/DUF939 family)